MSFKLLAEESTGNKDKPGNSLVYSDMDAVTDRIVSLFTEHLGIWSVKEILRDISNTNVICL